MKRTATCPKCDSQRVMRVARVADAADWTGSGEGALDARSGDHFVPRRILQTRKTVSGVFGGKSEAYKATGEVDAYVCAECGYFEEYLRDPQSIDWGSVVGASPRTPPEG